MFWSLFIFRWHSTREPASVVCDEEQGDFFYLFCRPTQEPALNTANKRKSQKSFGRKWRWMGREGEKQKQRNSWQLAKRTWLYSDLIQAYEGKFFELWILNRWNHNFCVHSFPLRCMDRSLDASSHRATFLKGEQAVIAACLEYKRIKSLLHWIWSHSGWLWFDNKHFDINLHCCYATYNTCFVLCG